MTTPPQTIPNLKKKDRLGKIVTQIEMNNPETRKYLKDVLEAQIKEKNLKKRDELAQLRAYQQNIKEQSDIVAQEQAQLKERKRYQ